MKLQTCILHKLKHAFTGTSAIRRFHFTVIGEDMREWLAGKGYRNDIATGMMKAFTDGNTSPTLLKHMSDNTLRQLADAVQRELKEEELQKGKELINVNISIPKERMMLQYKAHEGDNIINLCNNNIELKQYLICACGGIAACSTCHVFIDNPMDFMNLSPLPDESEQDMLDLAYGSIPSKSRLGCQIKFNKNCEGITLRVPDQSNNLV